MHAISKIKHTKYYQRWISPVGNIHKNVQNVVSFRYPTCQILIKIIKLIYKNTKFTD